VKKPITLMIDSGAFSAWTQNKEIDIDEYIQFCLKYDKYVDYFVNLDIIPGKGFGITVKAEEYEEGAERGWRNYLYMLEKGVKKEKLIHVFHQGERFEHLKRMLEFGTPYIGISPTNDKTTEEKKKWIDSCMPYVLDEEGFPVVKFHGFGLTSLKLMLRYPWYSVDSTSWVVTARIGQVFVPRLRGNKWIYDENSWKVLVSSRSPSKGEKGKHFYSFTPRERKIISRYFDEKGYILGKSEFKTVSSDYKLKDNEKWFGKEINGKRVVEIIIERGLCNEYILRDELNAIYFVDLEEHLPKWPWPFRFEKGTKQISFNLCGS